MSKDYNSWEDFMEDKDLQAEQNQTKASEEPAFDKDQIELPEDVLALLERKEKLEEHLKKLTGHGETDPAEDRYKLMYPIKVHTKETRIEQRKERKAEEKRRFNKLKALEKKISQKKAEETDALRREEAFKSLVVQYRMAEKWKLKQEELKQQKLKAAKAQFQLQEKMNRRIFEALKERKALEAEYELIQLDLDDKLEQLREQNIADLVRQRQQVKSDQKKLDKIWEGQRQQRLQLNLAKKKEEQRYFYRTKKKKEAQEREGKKKKREKSFELSNKDLMNTHREKKANRKNKNNDVKL